MSEQGLVELYSLHEGKVSDKWNIYLSEYERVFNKYRGQEINFIEIGVQNGGSLDVWSKYFHAAEHLIGCDINPDCNGLEYEDERVSIVINDAGTDEAKDEILKITSSLDIVLDDGSHKSGDIIKSFAQYFPHINDGGLYVAEDLHCSYWQQFEGGIFYPYSSVAFFKRLADVINHEHWGVDRGAAEILEGFFQRYNIHIEASVLSEIHSIEFVNSMCFVKKKPKEKNILGKRWVVGETELVVAGHAPLNSALGESPDQSENKWSVDSRPPEEKLEELRAELEHGRWESEEYKSQLNRKQEEAEGLLDDLTRKQQEAEGLLDDLTRKQNEAEEILGQLTDKQENLLIAQDLSEARLVEIQALETELSQRYWLLKKIKRKLFG